MGEDEFELGLPIEVEEVGELRAVAFCVGTKEGESRFRVLLKLEDGRVVASERSFATPDEAHEFGVGWLHEHGAEVAQ